MWVTLVARSWVGITRNRSTSATISVPGCHELAQCFRMMGAKLSGTKVSFFRRAILLIAPRRMRYFSGGHGDFSVVLDREQKFFYFLFTNYGGPVETQGS